MQRIGKSYGGILASLLLNKRHSLGTVYTGLLQVTHKPRKMFERWGQTAFLPPILAVKRPAKQLPLKTEGVWGDMTPQSRSGTQPQPPNDSNGYTARQNSPNLNQS